MFNPQRGPYSVGISHFAEEAAQRLGVQYVAAPVFEPTQIEAAITTLAHEPNGALIISPDAFTVTHRQQMTATKADLKSWREDKAAQDNIVESWRRLRRKHRP
jgi:hypothetical protein